MQRIPEDPLRNGAIFQLRSPIISPPPTSNNSNRTAEAPSSSQQTASDVSNTNSNTNSTIRQLFEEVYRATPLPKHVSSTDLLQRRPISHMVNNMVTAENQAQLGISPSGTVPVRVPSSSNTQSQQQSTPTIESTSNTSNNSNNNTNVTSPRAQTLASILAPSMITNPKPIPSMSGHQANPLNINNNSSSSGSIMNGNTNNSSNSSPFFRPNGSPSFYSASTSGSRVSMLPSSTLPSLTALQARAAQAQHSSLFPPRGPVAGSPLTALAAKLGFSPKPVVVSPPYRKINLLDPFSKPETVKSPEKSGKSTDGIAMTAYNSSSSSSSSSSSGNQSSSKNSGVKVDRAKPDLFSPAKAPTKSPTKAPSASHASPASVKKKNYAVLESQPERTNIIKKGSQSETAHLDRQLQQLRRELYGGRPRSKSVLNGLDERVLTMSEREMRALTQQLKLECFQSKPPPTAVSSSSSSASSKSETLTASGMKRKSLDGRVNRELAKYKNIESLQGKKPVGLPKTPVVSITEARVEKHVEKQSTESILKTSSSVVTGSAAGSRGSRANTTGVQPPLLQALSSRPALTTTFNVDVTKPPPIPEASQSTVSANYFVSDADLKPVESSANTTSAQGSLKVKAGNATSVVAPNTKSLPEKQELPTESTEDTIQTLDWIDDSDGEGLGFSYPDFAPGFADPEMNEVVLPKKKKVHTSKTSSVKDSASEKVNIDTAHNGEAQRGRGRPPKIGKNDEESNQEPETEAETETAPVKRGRPPKANKSDHDEETEPSKETEPEAAPVKRGRPPKANKSDHDEETEPSKETETEAAPVKRGRPPKPSKSDHDEETEPSKETETEAATVKRGRPPKASKSSLDPGYEVESESESAPAEHKYVQKVKSAREQEYGQMPKSVALSPKRGRPPNIETSEAIVNVNSNEDVERKRDRPPKLPGQSLMSDTKVKSTSSHNGHILLSFDTDTVKELKKSDNANKISSKVAKIRIEPASSASTTSVASNAADVKPKKRGRPSSADAKPRVVRRDDNAKNDADTGADADQAVKRKRIGAVEMKRIAKELSIAEEEDDIFNSGFFDNLNTSSQSFYDLSSSHFAANDSLFEDIDFVNDGVDDSILTKSSPSTKKGKSGDWKVSYVNKLSRKVKTISMTREDDDDDGQAANHTKDTLFRGKSNGAYLNSSLEGKGSKKRKAKKVEEEEEDDDEEEYEREGSRLDDDVWEFKKGSMRVSSDMPYEGDLSGDEDGDFN